MNVIGMLLQGLADLVRMLVRCLFPLAALLVFALLLMSDQGGDVLRIEAVATDRVLGLRGMALLLLATTVLAASVWYCMRWLLVTQMAALPLDMERTAAVRTWLPRLAGAAVFLAVSWAVRNLGDLPGVGWEFAAAALAFLGFTVARGRLLRRLNLAQTRAPDRLAAPAVLGRDIPLPPVTRRVVLASLAFSFLLAAALLLWPVSAPRQVGALVLVPLALASINIFGSFVLTWWPLRNGLPGLAPVALLVAALFGAWNDNHHVREGGWTPRQLQPDRRSDVNTRFDAWRGPSAGDHYVVVATEGGGIRAALWTAALLRELEQVPGFREHLFAVSGVSGGSLGAAAYLSQRYAELAGGPACSAVADLKRDFLSPPLAGMLYADLMQRFLPFAVPLFDRARNLELSWQQAFADCAGAPMRQTLAQLYAGHPQLPLVLLNTTVVETGRRAVLADVQAGEFNDVVDLMRPSYSSSAQPLAGLAHDSARFPAVSPAGTVMDAQNCADQDRGCARYRVVDGGYFDNSGAITAAELIQAVQSRHRELHPVLLLLRNDFFARPICNAPAGGRICRDPAQPQPGFQGGGGHPGRFAPELTAPVLGLYDASAGHGRLAAVAAAVQVERVEGGRVFDLALQLPESSPTRPVVMPPLGWELSRGSQETIVEQAAQLVAARRAELEEALR
ncbi:MAG TPA: hypothetical protein VFA75_06525 [Nevskia sp.]|nr:hypothetical protein [Nevskia sp.]